MSRGTLRVRSSVSIEAIAIMWSVPRIAVLDWISSELMQRDRYGVVTRNELLRFVESPAGREALRTARAAE